MKIKGLKSCLRFCDVKVTGNKKSVQRVFYFADQVEKYLVKDYETTS